MDMSVRLTVSASSSTVGHCEHDVMTSRELRNWLPILWRLSPRKRTDECVMEPNFLCMLCNKQKNSNSKKDQKYGCKYGAAVTGRKFKKISFEIDLKQSGKHVEGVNSRGTVCIRQHLVDMATPRVLFIVIGDGLECCQDSREEGRRGRRGLDLWEAVCVTVILAETHTEGPISYNLTCFSHRSSPKDTRKQTHAQSPTSENTQRTISRSLPVWLRLVLQCNDSSIWLQRSCITTRH